MTVKRSEECVYTGQMQVCDGSCVQPTEDAK